MGVLISSAANDLIDIRDELAEQLKSIGVTSILSDAKHSKLHKAGAMTDNGFTNAKKKPHSFTSSAG